MRPRPKIRKTVKWGGAAASVLLAVVWVGSGRIKACGWSPIPPGAAIAIWRGQAICEVSHSEAVAYLDPCRWHLASDRNGLQWGFDLVLRDGDTAVAVPLWMPLVIVLAATAFAWMQDRHSALFDACTKCGYDRAGIAARTACPECGSPSSSSSPSPRATEKAEEARAPSASESH